MQHFAAIARVHTLMSFHDGGSDLGRLRWAPPGEPVSLAPDTVRVLRLASELYQRSGGLFDITCATVLVRDGFLPLPVNIELDDMDGTATDIEIIDDLHVRCGRPLLIDLGGIAKGYAVDAAIDVLKKFGADRALVNAGGDLRVLGDIEEPVHLRSATGTLEGALRLSDMALASSSNLGQRHIERGVAAVPHRGSGHVSLPIDEAISVVAPTCAIADAMTKIAIADRALAAAMLTELGGAIVDRQLPLAA